jgi:DNA-binding MarR family transcriptional regulator
MEISLQDVGLAVKRLQWRHHREANRRLAPLGISLAQWDVLRQLDAHPEASLHDLAQLTFQTDQSMGTLANRMIERGLLHRQAGPGRAVRHGLTHEGERLRLAGANEMDAVFTASLGSLSRAQLSELHRLLTAATAD